MDKIYEVLQVIESKPIFLKEHLQRLQQSWLFTHEDPLDLTTLEWEIGEIASSRKDTFNLRIEVDLLTGESTVCSVEGIYPTEEMKREGVEIATFPFQRPNPQLKVYDPNLRDAMAKRREDRGVYSLLYVHEGEIGECEKANIFFVKEGRLITARDEDVLLGITRMKVLESAEKQGIPIEKRIVREEELSEMEAAFMSGTSIHVLPVSKIDHHQLDPGHYLVQQISAGFERLVGENMDQQEDVLEEDREERKQEWKEPFPKEEPMKRLYRSNHGMLAGVCAGIADYFQIDPTLVRLAWVFLAPLAGVGLISYIIAAIIIPKNPELDR